MDVGQALINERTFDCVASVCMCACVTLSVLYLLQSRWWMDLRFYTDLSINFASSSRHMDFFLPCFGAFTFKLDGMLTLLDV